VIESWVHRYDNVVRNANDQAFKVAHDAAGDIIVTGTTIDGSTRSDMLTIKYSGADGSVLWQQRYNGPANSDDIALAVAVDGSGNVVIAGLSYLSIGHFSIADCYTAKYAAADGTLLWEHRGPVGSASAVAVDSSGNVVITGFSGNFFSSDYYTAKYAAADGALLWEQHYDGPANNYDYAQALALDARGNVVVTGTSYNSSGRGEYYTAKYAAGDGALLWDKRYFGPTNSDDSSQSVAVDRNGNVVVTGTSNGDYYTAKYAAANGALLWEHRYDGPANSFDSARAVALDASGNVVVTGSSYNGTNDDVYTAKYAAVDGALLWEKRYNGPANSGDLAEAVAVDGGGNVVVAGYSDGDYYTAKYAAADGTLLWEKRYSGPGNSGDEAKAVTVDASGNVVVTGDAWNGDNYDFYTAKYAAPDGALLWDQTYNGPVPIYDAAEAVAVDGSGNVVVTGFSYNSDPNSDPDYYTAKYAAADGALLWEKRYNGPDSLEDRARAVVTDGTGNVVVTGYSIGSSFNPDYYTAKYAAADGALLWEKRYNGPANGDDAAQAVAVDGSGNVVVTGSSHNGSDSDYYTAKYAAADGALLWEKRYDGPGNSSDAAQALAVDGSGNVVVTGYSVGSEGNADYYTAKYAAADGTLLWEKRYNGPGNNDDQATAVKIDAFGNVVVTGTSVGALGSYDYYTAKYAGLDGELLWVQRFNAANSDAFAKALAVDGSGNVLVTGSIESFDEGLATLHSDFYTAKYAAADGALLWEKHYSGAGIYNSAAAVAVDGSGNAVVTGSSYNAPPDSDSDYYTAKYAAADGALLWEIRYNGPVHGNDNASHLALGPNGMIAVTGSSGGVPGSFVTSDYATVVYKENILDELKALRAGVTDDHDGKKLDEAIKHLTTALEPARWIDQTHLQRQGGEKVFDEERQTVHALVELLKDRKSTVPDAILQAFIDALLRADRLLAVIGVDEAEAAGVKAKKIAEDRREIAQGDDGAARGKFEEAIDHYRNAWKHAVHIKIDPPHSLAAGGVRLQFIGIEGETYVIQASNDLIDWITLGTARADSDGVVALDDPGASQRPSRFYRVVSP
jgi:uncharacterized delta-60 repeat protein